MKLQIKLTLVALALLSQGFGVMYSQAAAPAPDSLSVVVSRGKVNGISNDIVTVLHMEAGRQVEDPVLISEQTQIWLGKKLVTLKNIRLRQYLRVSGVKEGELIVASRIDILSGAAVSTPKPKPKR
jgi:hypothetical protein